MRKHVSRCEGCLHLGNEEFQRLNNRIIEIRTQSNKLGTTYSLKPFKYKIVNEETLCVMKNRLAASIRELDKLKQKQQ